MSHPNDKAREIEAAIAGLEAQRAALGDAVVEPALAALRQQLREIDRAEAAVGFDEERKVVTVVFVDVSGFTALSEKLDPEEVRNLINGCFEFLVPVIQKFEGTIDKFIGDEIMALFGAPIAHENDPERALRAALELMDAIEAFNREHGTALDLHIGVNTGPVVTGQVGSQNRQDYSVMGDAVNLAARLEDASKDGEIYVGPNTHRQTERIFDFEPVPQLELKGKTNPVEIHRLVGLKKTPTAARGITGLRARLVGRERELAEIQSAISAITKGSGGICAIIGEAGLGKSRLVAEARESLGDGAVWVEGRGVSHAAGMSYWVARDVLNGLLQIKAGAPPAHVERALRGSIEEVSPGNMADLYPYLARLLELPLQDEMEERIRFLKSEALQARILQAFQGYVRALAGRRPLVLFWEDLHWCDPSSLRVLEVLLPLMDEVPVLLILAYRPDADLVQQFEERIRSACGERYRAIELSPLTREQSSSFIENLLKIENFPDKMRGIILDRAEGNPFFLEELLRSLLDAGIIVLENDRFVTTRAIESVDVPDTLQAVLTARIDRLPSEKKHALQNAAVIGRIFQQRVLAHLYGDSDPKKRLEDSLSELQSREFIRAKEPVAQREYIFRHTITHDVTYNSLFVSRRKELHKQVGEALEEMFSDRLDESSATLGYHFEKAEAHEKAIHHLRRAAERAQSTFANPEAIAFYRRALEQLDLLLVTGATESLEQSAAEIQESIGDIELLTGRHEEARASYDSALLRVPQSRAVWRSRLHRKTAKVWILEHQYENSAESYQKAEIVLQSRASSTEEWQQEWLQNLLDRMWLHYWQGQVQEIAALAEHIRPLIEEHATPLQRGSFFQGLTLMALRRDRYTANEQTIANAKTSLAAIEESKALPAICHARFVLGFSYLWAGQFDLAEEWLGNALKMAEQTGDIVLQSRCLTYLTVIHRRRDDVEGARRYAGQSLSSATAARMPEYIGMAKGNLAWVHLRDGDVAAAYQEADEGVEKIRQTPQGHILLWVALWPLIGVALARERLVDAISHAKTLLVPPQMAIPAGLEAELRTAAEAWESNDREKAALCLKKAAELAKSLGYL